MSGAPIGFGLGLAVALGFLAPGRAFADEADDALKDGVAKAEESSRLREDGETDAWVGPLLAAVKHLDRAIQLRPDDARGYAWRGRALRLEAETERALSDLDTAIRLDPRLVMAYRERGLAYVDANRLGEAIRDFNQAIQLDPNGADSYVGRAEALASQHKSQEALADYARAIRLQPSSVKAYLGRISLHAELNDTDPMLADIDAIIRLKPDLIPLRRARALTLCKLERRPDQAIEDFDKVISRGKPDAIVFLMRGQLLANRGHYDRAIQDYGEAIRLAPEPAAVLFGMRGAAYQKSGQNDRALRDFDEAIRLDPRSDDYRLGRSVVHERLGQIDEAIRDSDEAIRLAPESAGHRVVRESLAVRIGDFDRAFREDEEALRLDPGRESALFNRDLLALALDRDGTAGSARPHLLRKGWRGENGPCIALAGYLVERRANHPAEARALLDEAILRCDPKAWPMPILRHLHGDETEDSLLKAPRHPTEQVDVHFFLGIDRLLSGDRASALAHLRQARDEGGDDRFAGLARAVLRRVEDAKAK